MSTSQHLVKMANDIGDFFKGNPNREEAIIGIENHIKSFWSRRMREKLFAELDEGAAGLNELPKEAVRRLIKNPHFKPDQPPGGDAG
jgi:formate dehydrogenase subunit delta